MISGILEITNDLKEVNSMRAIIGIAGLISMAMCIGAVIFLIMGNPTVAVPLVSVGLVILIVSYGAATYISHNDKGR